MAPDNTPPHAGETTQPIEPNMPEPKPGQESDEPVRGNPDADRAPDAAPVIDGNSGGADELQSS